MDEVRLLSAGSTCGEKGPNEGEKGFPVKRQRAAMNGDGKERFFDLGRITGPVALGYYEVCYCEFGRCNDDRRFGQRPGQLTVRWAECTVRQYEYADSPESLPRGRRMNYVCHEGHTTTGSPSAPREFSVI